MPLARALPRCFATLLFSLPVALTCARPLAPGPAAPAAGAPSAAEPDDGPLPPLPRLPPPTPVKDYPELLSLQILARDVSQGFETLVAATPESIGCTHSGIDTAEVRIEGGADPRRPWSFMTDTLGYGPLHDALPSGSNANLMVRRPLPAPGEKQIAHVVAVAGCDGGAAHYRFALPDADPTAHSSVALAIWARTFENHSGGATGWSHFAGARLGELYPTPRPAPAPLASNVRADQAGATSKSVGAAKSTKRPKADGAKKHGERGAKARAPATPAPRPTVLAPRPRVTGPRRDPSELARLMDTTTGLTSLQETLQTDRWLVTDAAEPATVPFAEVKPPPLAAHPFAAMSAALGHPVPTEPLAAAAPADFYFVRFKSLTHLFELRDQLDGGIGPALPVLDGRFDDYDVAARYEAALGVKQSALTRFLGPSVVEDLAIVGSDPYLREGSDLTLIFRIKAAPAFEAALAGTLALHGAAHGGLTSSTVERSGISIHVARSADGAVNQHRASAGGFEIVSNSLGATERVLAAIAQRAPRLADEPDFRYMLARDADVPADVLAFMSDRFVAAVAGPRQKILEARRQLAAAELARPGYAALLYGWLYGAPPAGAEALVASGLLKPAELAHAGGEAIDWQPGRAARSSWGRIGALTPLIDLPPPDRVTPTERDAYAMFVAGYQNYWRAYIDPIAVRIALGTKPGAPIGFDLRILPIITGTDYSEVSRTVGRARVALPSGRRGLRTALGIGPDAELRHLLSQSLRELPLVGALKIDWLGDWALLGMDDTRRKPSVSPQQLVAMSQIDRLLVNLVELPLYAGIEIRSRAAAAAFLAGARQVIEQAAPGVIDWHEAGKERDVPFVAVRAAAGSDESKSAWHDLSLYYSFCKSSLLLSLSEASLRRRIDDCVDGTAPRALTADGAQGPQWIVESDLRERGPAWWWLVYAVTEGGGHFDSGGSRLTIALAEAILRGAPRISPSAAHVMGRQIFGAAPVTPEGRDYLLADDGLRDPVRGRLSQMRAPMLDLIADPDSPLVRLLRSIGHARSEVSFDDEPTIANQRARSLHVRLQLAAAPPPR